MVLNPHKTLALSKGFSVLFAVLLLYFYGPRALKVKKSSLRRGCRIGIIQVVNEVPYDDRILTSTECADRSRGQLVFTYDNSAHTDGAGSQLQRILSLFAASQALGIGYAHTGIGKLDYQGLQALENNTGDAGLVGLWNAAFPLPSIRTAGCNGVRDGKDGCKHITMGSPTLHDVQQLSEEACNGRVVVHAAYGDGLLDSRPTLGRSVAGRFHPHVNWLADPQLACVRGCDAVRIAVHVRRGELFVVDSHRMLPNSFYVQLCQQLHRVLVALRLPHVFEIYTEVPTKRLVITPNHHGIFGRSKSDVVVDPSDSHLEDFAALPNTVFFLNTDPIDTLKRLSTAHVLIMSKSSFSYVAGMLHDPERGLVLYYPFWHKPLPDWYVVNENMEDNETSLAAAIDKRFKRVC